MAMSEHDYEHDCYVEGGIHAFDGLTEEDQSKVEIGQEAVPSPEAAKRYARFVESLLDSQQVIENDEEFLAAA